MNAVWVIDYDYRTDKCYKAPGCPICEEPIFKNGDIYRCFSCGRPVEVNGNIRTWLAVREETKTEMRDCPKINLRSGENAAGVDSRYHKWRLCTEKRAAIKAGVFMGDIRKNVTLSRLR